MSILDTDNLEQIDTDFQLLPKGNYPVKVASVEVKHNAEKGTDTLAIRMQLETAATKDTKGRLVNVGFPITGRLFVSVTEKHTKDMVSQKLAKLQECFLGKKKMPFDTEDFIGKDGIVSLGIEPAKDGYPERNEVNAYIKKVA